MKKTIILNSVDFYSINKDNPFMYMTKNKSAFDFADKRTWDYQEANNRSDNNFYFEFSNNEDYEILRRNLHDYDYEIIDGNLVLTLHDDTIRRHDDAQKHNAPGFAYMDAIYAFEENAAKLFDGIKTAMIRLDEVSAARSSGDETAATAAVRKFNTAVAACDKIDLHQGQEWVECVRFTYRLHNDFMGIFVGRQNTPQNHALAATYAKFTQDLYYEEVLITNAETGEKKHDAIFHANGLYAKPRLPSIKKSGVRRNICDVVLLALRQNYEYDAADFENGRLTAAGEEKITVIVVAADPTRAMPPDDTDSAPTVEPAAAGDSE